MEPNQKSNIWIYSIIGMLTTIVVLSFARLSYGVILPFMREGLALTYKEAGYLGTTTSLGYLATVIFAGIVASKWGGKKTIIFGVLLATSGLAGLTFTPAYGVTMIWMLILGVGTAFTYTPLISLLVAWFPQKKGLVIGLTTSGVGVGMVLTGVIVPYLDIAFIENGWRAAWGLFAAFGLLVALLLFIFMKNPPSSDQEEEDNNETKPIEIYKNPDVINVAMIYGIIGLAYIIQMIFVMSFMIESNISMVVAGQLMALNGILSIFSGPIWGFISDKIGRKKSLHITMALVLFAMCLPIIEPTLINFVVHMIILSCTLTGVFTLIQAATMDQVQPKDMPVTFSYATFYFAAGQFLGPTIAGWLIEDWGGFRNAFLFSSIALFIGFILTFRIKSKAQTQRETEDIQVKAN